MKIKSLRFNEGPQVNLTSLTILIGPNNTGKSLALREIQRAVRGSSGAIITRVTLEPRDFDGMLEDLGARARGSNLVIKQHGLEKQLPARENFKAIFDMYGYENVMRSQGYVDGSMQYLGTAERFALTAGQNVPNLETNSQLLPVQRLLKDLDAAARLSELMSELFGVALLVDNSAFATIKLRVAESPPEIANLDADDLRAVLGQFPLLEEQGDGMRSLAGVALSVLLEQRSVLLIDEPDAFLHPEQARALGRWLSTNIKESGNQIVLATHNEDLLYGLLASRPPITVLRLTRPSSSNTAVSVLEPKVLEEIAVSPLLSGQAVLHALFQTGVVVVEAPADRSVYESVASRFGPVSVVFVHAQGKHTLNDIARLMMNAAVPVAVIADLDLLRVAEDFTSLAELFLPDDVDKLEAQRRMIFDFSRTDDLGDIADSALQDIRNWVIGIDVEVGVKQHGPRWLGNRLLEIIGGRTRWDKLKKNGIEGLEVESQPLALELLNRCANAGLFVVPVGELERWFGVPKGRRGTSRMLEKIHKGETPQNLSDFVDSVVADLERKSRIPPVMVKYEDPPPEPPIMPAVGGLGGEL